jgi:hypothetical protein
MKTGVILSNQRFQKTDRIFLVTKCEFELKTLVQERANYKFKHFWKNEVDVCEQKIAIITQL